MPDVSPSANAAIIRFPDIQYYISSNLSNNPGFVELQGGDPKYASSLIDNVSTKASGVFLWVVLVVSILQSLPHLPQNSQILWVCNISY
jgi:hypothetical protein